jgi:GT2 family glycosyltransferase
MKMRAKPASNPVRERVTTSVVIPTWQRPDDLERGLRSLAGQSRPPDEVVVAARDDDAATWSMLESLELEQPLKRLRVGRPGVVNSLNAALDAAGGDVVAITDDDSIPHTDWLARIVEVLERRPDVGGVGGRDWWHQDGRIVDDEESPVGKVLWFGRVTGNHHLGAGAPREVDILKGVNMAWRREALEGIRLEPRLRGSGMQMHWEVGLSLAVKKAGWKLVYDPAIAVDHYLAPRLDEALREGLSPEALGNEVYNHAYGLLTGLPPLRRAVVYTYAAVVGTRMAPGPVVALERLVRGKHPRADFVASTRARRDALRDYLRSRR